MCVDLLFAAFFPFNVKIEQIGAKSIISSRLLVENSPVKTVC